MDVTDEAVCISIGHDTANGNDTYTYFVDANYGILLLHLTFTWL